jgi:rhodanese-related sulfurtransferase
MKMKQLMQRILVPVLSLAFLSAVSGLAYADDWSKLSKKKQTKLGLYMTAQQADDFIQNNMSKTLFVDIRTPGELTYLGTPGSVDAHVPFELMDTTQWNDKKKVYKHYENKNFVADIEARMKKKGLGKEDNIVFMCRSGNRSAKAVNLMAAAGYTKVYNMIDGYEGDKAKDGPTKGKRTVNGWKNAGLPWSYHLDKDVMYFTK